MRPSAVADAEPLPPDRTPSASLAWRSDIEGLRGVAVLLVVLFHAGISGFAGGYVGVDVFFALSGYLITGILVREVERTGAVDLARFYARRVRRLLPASALVLLATVAFAFAFYSPLEQGQIAWTAVATASYLSNVHFAQAATDYFAVAVETNPLLHTWSLAVEEQFYLVWPALVWFGLRGAPSRRRLVAVVVAVTVASFGAAVWAMQTAPTWAFFGSPLRAWEFGVGALAAVLPSASLAVRARISALLGWTGLAAVVASGVFYSVQTPFPGATALLPVVGTVAVLLAGAWSPGRGVARVLGTWPLQQFGRLSYSWYLWHWPVFVFAEGLYGKGSLPVRLALLLFSLLLAEASYRLVEDPIRHHRWIAATPRRGLALLATLTVLCVAVSGAWGVAVGVLRRAPEQQRLITARDLDVSDLLA
ncbi:MAG TPA: acyltransferase, partial [Rhodothermales bacterium]|nr:acyltransferase [Rhodothermales bacterium]